MATAILIAIGIFGLVLIGREVWRALTRIEPGSDTEGKIKKLKEANSENAGLIAMWLERLFSRKRMETDTQLTSEQVQLAENEEALTRVGRGQELEGLVHEENKEAHVGRMDELANQRKRYVRANGNGISLAIQDNLDLLAGTAAVEVKKDGDLKKNVVEAKKIETDNRTDSIVYFGGRMSKSLKNAREERLEVIEAKFKLLKEGVSKKERARLEEEERLAKLEVFREEEEARKEYFGHVANRLLETGDGATRGGAGEDSSVMGGLGESGGGGIKDEISTDPSWFGTREGDA